VTILRTSNCVSLILNVCCQVGHVQILVQSQTVFEIEYPENFRRLLERMDIFQLDFLKVFSVQCYAKLNLLDEYVLLLLAVPMGILLIYACGKIFNTPSTPTAIEPGLDSDIANPIVVDPERPTDDDGTDSEKSITGSTVNVRDSIFVFLFMLYPGLSTKTFHIFACQKLPPGAASPDEAWHRFDYSISCLTSSYAVYEVLAIVAMFVYLIGIPCFFLHMMYPHRQSLQSSGTNAAKEQFRFFVRVSKVVNLYVSVRLLTV
jgi:hypothetical protein